VTCWVLCYFRHGINGTTVLSENHHIRPGRNLTFIQIDQVEKREQKRRQLFLVFLLRQQRRQESATFLPMPLMNIKKMRNCPTRPSMSNHNVAHRLNGIHKNHIYRYGGKQSGLSSFQCLHESGSGLSSYIRAPGSACIMRCSNAFTQLSMLLKKIQHT
jgi:hypothetical protein